MALMMSGSRELIAPGAASFSHSASAHSSPMDPEVRDQLSADDRYLRSPFLAPVDPSGPAAAS
jgi:hypothetical protein